MEGVNIKLCWNKGRLHVENFLQISNTEDLEGFVFSELPKKVTMLTPAGFKIGVTELEADWSCENAGPDENPEKESVSDEDEDVDSEEEEEEDIDESGTSLIGILEETAKDGVKQDPQISIEGKSTILKQTFVGTSVSKDRLRRVQGLSKHVGVGKENTSYNLDDILLQGDPVMFILKERIHKKI